jgi:hypothetical protein
MEKLKSEDIKNLGILAAVVVGIIILYQIFKGMKGAAGGFMDIFGAGTQADEVDKKIAAKDKTKKSQNPWSTQYMLSRQKANPTTTYSYLTGATKTDMLKQIQDTGGFWRLFPDTGTPLLAMFKTIGHKMQVSDLANAFQVQTGKDLLTYIKGQLQDVGILGQTERNANLNALINYVDGLPE